MMVKDLRERVSCLTARDVLRAVGLERRSHVGPRLLGGFGIFAVGLLAGAVVGLTLAPMPGSTMRGEIRDRLKDLRVHNGRRGKDAGLGGLAGRTPGGDGGEPAL